IRRVGTEMKNEPTFGPQVRRDMEIHGVNALTDSAGEIGGRFTTTPMDQWATGRERLGRVQRAFDDEGITCAFPRHALYSGQGDVPLDFQASGGAPESAPQQ